MHALDALARGAHQVTVEFVIDDLSRRLVICWQYGFIVTILEIVRFTCVNNKSRADIPAMDDDLSPLRPHQNTASDSHCMP